MNWIRFFSDFLRISKVSHISTADYKKGANSKCQQLAPSCTKFSIFNISKSPSWIFFSLFISGAVQHFSSPRFTTADAQQLVVHSKYLLCHSARVLHWVCDLLFCHVLFDILPRLRLWRGGVQLLPGQNWRAAILWLLLWSAGNLGDAHCDVQCTPDTGVAAAHVWRHIAGLRYRAEQTVVVGVLGASTDRHLHHFRVVGPALPQNQKLVSLKELSGHLLTAWRRLSDGRPGVLCVPPNQTKLPHCSLTLAHGNGAEPSLSPAQPKNLSTKVLTSGHHLSLGIGYFVIQSLLNDDGGLKQVSKLVGQWRSFGSRMSQRASLWKIDFEKKSSQVQENRQHFKINNSQKLMNFHKLAFRHYFS